jgi:hypothetical protein
MLIVEYPDYNSPAMFMYPNLHTHQILHVVVSGHNVPFYMRDILNLLNASGRTRPWGLLSL